ncbi:MAG: Uma2 family endonuclease [Desulfococcaceae bacterium]|jgi:Uma2 family endonuclease|nr:Uma2 family endonuclease [Desulfococcaceae bacterium]
MEAILEQIVRSPKLELYSRQIQSVLYEERKKRERFYKEITEQQKAEFINGEIIMHSPVRIEHNITSGLLYKLLHTYVQMHHLGFAGIEKILITLTRNDYEPDICFWKREKSAAFKPGQMKFPAPDFIAEIISPSTEKTDRSIKWMDYAAHGVQEYWITDPANCTVEQYILENETYTLRVKMDSGTVKSQAVQGFDIPVRALFDEEENLAALKSLLP